MEEKIRDTYHKILGQGSLPTRFNSDDFQTSRNDSTQIGSGAYASVIWCQHKDLKDVAVKCYRLPQKLIKFKKKIKNATSEAAILNKISHRNIVQFHGYVTWTNNDANFYGIVIELCVLNLEEFILNSKTKKRALTWDLRLRIFLELAEALNYLHNHTQKRSFVHGDVKPQNVLLSEDLTVKLADFGSTEIEKAVGVNTISINIDANNQHTPLYTAPEFLNDPSKKKTSMDMFSYALIGFEMITLQKVYSNISVRPEDVIVMMKSKGEHLLDRKALKQVASELTNERDKIIYQELTEIFEGCYKVEPKSRLTAQEVSGKLRSLYENNCTATKNDYGRLTRSLLRKRKQDHHTISLSDHSFQDIFQSETKSFEKSEDVLSKSKESDEENSASQSKTEQDLAGSKSEEKQIAPTPETTTPEINNSSSIKRNSIPFYPNILTHQWKSLKLSGSGNRLPNSKDRQFNTLQPRKHRSPIDYGNAVKVRSKEESNEHHPTQYNSDAFRVNLGESSVLGSGSYCTVVWCKHKELGHVALKYYHFLCGQEKSSDKICAEKEVSILSEVSHRHIVHCHGYTKWTCGKDNYFGIILEICKFSLEEFIFSPIDQKFKIPWGLRLRFFNEIADALVYLHRSHSTKVYVHGDLQPQNILLTKDLTVKLADFGSSEIIRSKRMSSNEDIKTSHSSCQHTPLYTAPEFLKDPSQKNPSMDIYSFAMVGYELVTFRQVYSESKAKMAMMVHFIADRNQKPDEKEFERVSKKLVNEDLDICQSLVDLIKSCWSTQPNLRPTALKVQKYLQELTKERKRSRDADICLSNYSHQHDKTKKTVRK